MSKSEPYVDRCPYRLALWTACTLILTARHKVEKLSNEDRIPPYVGLPLRGDSARPAEDAHQPTSAPFCLTTFARSRTLPGEPSLPPPGAQATQVSGLTDEAQRSRHRLPATEG